MGGEEQKTFLCSRLVVCWNDCILSNALLLQEGFPSPPPSPYSPLIRS